MIWRIEHIHHRLSLWIKQHNNGGQDGYVCEKNGINGSFVDADPNY